MSTAPVAVRPGRWQPLRRMLCWLLLLSLPLLLGLGFVLGQEAALNQWLPYLARQLPGAQIQIGAIRGSLWSGLSINRIDYRDAKQQLRLEQLKLDWQPWQLLRRHLVFSQISIGHFSGRTLQASPAQLPHNLALPLALDIERLQCQNFQWQNGSQRWQFSKLQFGLHDVAGYWQLKRASVVTPWGDVSLDGSVAQRGRLAVQARGLLLLPQPATPIKVSWQLAGDLQQLDWRAQTTVSADAVPAQDWQAELLLRPFDASTPLARVQIKANHVNPARLANLPQADLAIDVQAELQQGRWRGHVQIDNAQPGTLDQQRLPLRRLHSPVSGSASAPGLSAIVADFGPAGHLSGRLDWRAEQAERVGLTLKAARINLQAWHPKLHKSEIGGAINWQQTGASSQFQADLAQSGLQLALVARLARQQLQIETARLQLAGGQVQASGTLDLGAPGQFVGKGRIQHFDPAKLGRFGAGDINGQVQVSGQWANDWQLRLQGQLDASQWLGQPWRGHVTAQLNQRHWLGLDLDLQAGKNRLRASGALGQAADRVAWQFAVPDPTWLGWAGSLAGEGQLSGDGQQWHSTLALRLHDWRKVGAVAGPTATAQVAGQLGYDAKRQGLPWTRWSGDLAFDFAHLNPANWGDYPVGDVTGKGTLRLAPGTELGLGLEFANSRWQGQALSGHVRGRFEPDQWQAVDVSLLWGAHQLKAGQTGDKVRWRIESAGATSVMPPASTASATASAAPSGPLVQGELGGNPAAHQLSLTGSWQGIRTELAIDGGWQAGRGWQGRLARWQNLPGSPLWRMQNALPVQYSLESGQLIVGSGQFGFDGGQLQLDQLVLGPGGWRSRGRVHGLALDSLLWWRPEWRSAVATKAASGRLRLAGQWQIDAFEQLNGSLKLARESGDWQPGPQWPGGLGLQQLQLELALQQNALRVNFAIQGKELGQAQVQVATQLARQGGQWGLPGTAPLQVNGSARIDSLAPLAGLGQGKFQCDGRLEMKIEGNGTVAAPQLLGSLQAEQLRFDWIGEGLHLKNGSLRANWVDDRLVLQQAQFDGLKATGSLSLAGGKPALHLQFSAHQLPLISRPDREVVVSGESSVDLNGKGLRIAGQVQVDKAAIELRADDSPVTSDDIRLYRAGQLQEKPNPTLPVNIKLGVDLGTNFRVRGQGLDTRLAGKLQLQALEKRGPRLFGAVQVVDGNYRAYGQKLKIDQGEINFTGVWDNPGLHLTAWRQKVEADSEVEVGVELRGTLLAPRVRLVSNPALPDSEKLAWLVLGHGLEGSAGQELDVLGAASTAFFGSARDKVASRLGLDEFGVSYGKGLENAVFTIGKRISRRAYLSFEQGVGSATGLAKLRYTFNPRLSLQLQTGTSNAADVFYSWRFD